MCFTTPIDFHQTILWRTWGDEEHMDVDRLVDLVGSTSLRTSSSVPSTCWSRQPRRGQGAPVGQHVERRLRQVVPDDGPLDGGNLAAAEHLLPPGGQAIAARQRRSATGCTALHAHGGKAKRTQSISTTAYARPLCSHDASVSVHRSRTSSFDFARTTRQELIVGGVLVGCEVHVLVVGRTFEDACPVSHG